MVFYFKRYTCNNLLDLLILLSLLIFFHKAIVGLRQAQLACFQRFSTYLLQSGFSSECCGYLHLSSPFLYWLCLYRPFALCWRHHLNWWQRISSHSIYSPSQSIFCHEGLWWSQWLPWHWSSAWLLWPSSVTNQICFRLIPPDQHAYAWLQTLCHNNCFRLSALDGTPPSDPQAYRSPVGSLQYI